MAILPLKYVIIEEKCKLDGWINAIQRQTPNMMVHNQGKELMSPAH
jgi:hypothetical protein